MKIFSNAQTKGIATLIAVDENKVLTGSETGQIKLWAFNNKKSDYDFKCLSVFSKHSKKVYRLALLPNHRFLSCSADSLRIWHIDSGACEHILAGGAVYTIYAVTALPDDLVAVAGQVSPAWEGFDIWDMRTGKCIFKEQGPLHRAYGMSLGVTRQGYLAVQGNCAGDLAIWKVNRQECKEVSATKIGRLYSMAVQPTGEIITACFSLDVYAENSSGVFQKIKTIENGNVIDDIFPLGNYRVLTIDRQGNCSGTLKLWNYVTGSCERLDNSRTPSGAVSESHAVFPESGIVLSVSEGAFCIQRFPSICRLPQGLVEIRKNVRLLSQACRTGTSFFARLPKEVNVAIAAFTGDAKSENESHCVNWAAHCFNQLPLRNSSEKSEAKTKPSFK